MGKIKDGLVMTVIMLFWGVMMSQRLAAQTLRTAADWMRLADKETDLPRAIGYYQEILKLQPAGPVAAEAYNSMAGVRIAQGNFVGALEDAGKAVGNDPSKAKFYAQRAYIYIQLSFYDKAIADSEKAVELDPAQGNYYSTLSYCQTKFGRFREAEQTAQKGIDLNPASPYAYRNRGRARLRQARADAAIEDFLTSLKLRHTEAHRVYCDLAEAYEQKSDNQRALEYYQQSLNAKPGYFDAAVGKTQLEQRLKSTGAPSPQKGSSNFTGKRVALLIGNSTYKFFDPLSGQPVKDARAMQARLDELGFETVLAVEADRKQIGDKLTEFFDRSKDADVALVFYAGHGISHKGENFLLPVDVPRLKSVRFGDYALSVTNLIDQIQNQKPKYCVLILDACRENPFLEPEMDTVAFQRFKEIHIENKIKNCYVALATASGTAAYNSPGQNGYYTSAILKNLHRGRSINDIFMSVRGEVVAQTEKKDPAQRPELINRAEENLIL